MKADTSSNKLSLRQERIALRMLEEMAQGKRPFVGFRLTKSGALHEVTTETFVERESGKKKLATS